MNFLLLEWQLGKARRYSLQDRQDDRQRRPRDAAPATRLAFLCLVWQRLLELSQPEQLEALDRIRAWAGVSHQRRGADRALSKAEANALVQGDLIELGAHTVTHASLNVLSRAQQSEEICSSKSQFENIIGHPVTNFSLFLFGRRMSRSSWKLNGSSPVIAVHWRQAVFQ